jgi:hypothetical protein
MSKDLFYKVLSKKIKNYFFGSEGENNMSTVLDATY